MPRFGLARRLVAPAVLIAVLALALPAAASAASCPDGDLQPTPSNLTAVRAAVLCLHNEIRADHALPPLRRNPRLERAAARHSASMVSAHFFDHVTPAGTTMTDRIRSAGYLRGDAAWSIGENIAWGSGVRATPAQIAAAWMASKGHRANILRRSYREIGIGIEVGAPVTLSAAQGGATYTADFGVRSG